MNENGIKFLNYLYKDLFKSEEVMHDIDPRFIGNKEANIKRYIDRMQALHERVGQSERENDLAILKSFYYKKYVIKENEIPENYFEHQQEVALERGLGYIELNNQARYEIAKKVIDDQKKSLDSWIEYFVSKDSAYIPMWAKYWAFQGMLTLGNYDSKTNTFKKRSNGTIAPFIELNQEALALSIEMLIKTLDNKPINDQKLEKLYKSGSFAKIYVYILNNVLKHKNELSNTTNGKWLKYERGSDHMPLVNSLQGYNTGWCTAGEGTARSQLDDGDFYVYYSYDEKGEAKIPRLAIRMEDERIAEVRGVGPNQNIEPEMEEIIENKLNEFPDKEKYKKKVNNMKRVTRIYKDSSKLTKEDLKFLYEIETRIAGFGYQPDPRIAEILKRRNKVADLNLIFEDVDIFEKSLELYILKEAHGLKLPKTLKGDLFLNSLTTIDGVELPTLIEGSLNLIGLNTLENFTFPSVKGILRLSRLEKAKNVKFPEHLNSLDLLLLTEIENVTFPKIVDGNVMLHNLVKADRLDLPEVVGGNIFLNAFTNVSNLKLPREIGGDLYLSSLDSLDGLELPESIGGKIYLANGMVLTFEELKRMKKDQR